MRVHRVVPKRVIVFRDGVGDGQLDHVYGHEMPQIFQAFETMGLDKKDLYDTCFVSQLSQHKYWLNKIGLPNT